MRNSSTPSPIQPIISIIVPVFNAEKYIYRCLDSLLSQTFTDFEIILVDDGSTDNSGNICDCAGTRYYKNCGGLRTHSKRGMDSQSGGRQSIKEKSVNRVKYRE